MIAARFTGTSVRRVEDPRLLTGRGRYVDDVRLPGMLHAAFVRSPIAHARLIADRRHAPRRRCPGVARCRSTGADLREHVHRLVPARARPTSSRPLYAPSPRGTRALRRRSGRRGRRRRAAYRRGRLRRSSRSTTSRSPAVVDMDRRCEPGAARCCSTSSASNVAFRSPAPYGDTDAAFAAADPRGAASDSSSTATPTCRWRAAPGWPSARPRPASSTYHVAHQAPHGVRCTLAAVLRPARRPLRRPLRRHRRGVRAEGRRRPRGRRRVRRRPARSAGR